MNSSKRFLQAGVLLLAVTATAVGQVQVPFSDGGYLYNGHGQGPMHGHGSGAGYYGAYGGQSGAGATHVPLLGRTMFSLNGAVDGLGYEGSYASAATTIPLGTDSLHGWWLIDGRASISQNGGPFTNIGLVRRTHFEPMHADFGVGLFYDMDADEYENFGHTFHQIGVSAHMWTPHFDVNVNGYIPLGPSDRTVGSPDTAFFQNNILLQHGLDAALEGFDVDFGIRPPSWQQKNGTINLGVYSYSSESVDPFVGFQGAYSFQPKPGMRLSVAMTADDEFNPSGLFQLELWRGRSRGYSPSGRGLDPIRRRAHIVRQHNDPIFLTDPDTGERIRVVHVDNSAPEGGNGRFEDPYNELEDADGTLPPFVEVGMASDIPRSLPGDIIFVHEGLSRMDPGELTPDDPTDDTPLDPTDDMPGDLSGYDTGITLLAEQQLLGDGVQHIIETAEDGNFELTNDRDGQTPFISNPDGAAVTLADDTTVRGFDIVNSKTGVLAPDPTPMVNNSDGITGDVVIEDVNILINDPIFTAADFEQNDGDDDNPDIATFDIPLETGINILDSTATFNIDDVDILARDILLPGDIVDPMGDVRTISPVADGELVTALNVERGAPIVNFTGMIDNTLTLLEDITLDDGDPMTVDPVALVDFATLSAGGSAVRIVDTTGGEITIDGMINNVLGEGIMIDNADDTMITFNAQSTLDSSLQAALTVMNSDDSVIDFANDVTILNPAEAGVLLTDNMDSEIKFFDLTVQTPLNQALLDDDDPDTIITNEPVSGFIATRNGGTTLRVAGNSFLDIVGGPALVVSTPDGTTTNLDMSFTRLESTSSRDGGVDLGNVAGNFKTNRVTVIDSAGPAIKVTGVGNDPADAMDMFDANFGQVVVANSPGDPDNDIDPGVQGPGVILRENPNATFNFVTTDITTTNGLGFQAINSGTVNMITPAVIDATGGAAVDIENTIGETNGLAGWTFERLRSVGSSDEGVRLVDMVSDFTVRGETYIQDNAGFGIDISGVGVDTPGPDAVVIDFNEVNIVSRDNVGVNINDITGVVKFASVDIDSDIIDDAGDATPPTGLTDRPGGNAINIRNTFANDGRVELNGGIIRDATNDGIFIENSIATVQNMTITVSDVELDTDDGIQVVTTGTGSSVVLLQDNVIDHPVDDTVTDPDEADLTGDNGIRLIANGTGTLNATVLNNVIDSNDLLDPLVDSVGSLHATVESGTLNLNAVGQNDGNGEAPTNEFFLENLGGTFNVTQTSAGNLSTLNNNVDVDTDGVITFGAPNPQLPPPIMP